MTPIPPEALAKMPPEWWLKVDQSCAEARIGQLTDKPELVGQAAAELASLLSQVPGLPATARADLYEPGVARARELRQVFVDELDMARRAGDVEGVNYLSFSIRELDRLLPPLSAPSATGGEQDAK